MRENNFFIPSEKGMYVPRKRKSEALWYVRRVLNSNENFSFGKAVKAEFTTQQRASI
jgi:hypothetical protein